MRPRLTFANVTSVIALFVALGGSSYAAIQLSKGSVKKKHLAKNAVVSKKVKDGSLLKKDFKVGQLPAGASGPQGPKGDTGPQGPKGDAGIQGESATKLFASVSEAGALVRGSGAVSAAKGSGGTGFYEVTFSRADLSGCVPFVDVGGDNAYYAPAIVATTVVTVSDPHKIGLRFQSHEGAALDRPFYLAVLC